MKKYIKLMAEYCSSGLWDENGFCLDIDSLPIHFWLKRMIGDWQAEYDRLSFSTVEGIPYGANFDIESFSKRGYALAIKLKQNLPDWEIEYYDEQKAAVAYYQNLDRSTFIEKIEL